jgi:hypothetical protein
MQVSMSMAIRAGKLIQSDGRVEASEANSVPGAFTNIVPGLDVLQQVTGNSRMRPQFLGDDPSQFLVTIADSEREAPAPEWSDFLVCGLLPDWKAIDRELRQLLSGLGGLAGDPDGVGAAPPWPVWVCVAATLLLARRASAGRRRVFSRPARESTWVSARRSVPVGPWPLSSP